MLIENIPHYILIKNLYVFLTNEYQNNNHVCRNCLNIFYSENRFKEHKYYCENRKAQKLLPSSDKYLKFSRLKNCIQNDFTIYSYFEFIINKETKQHEFVSGGYIIKCRNDKHSKSVKTFNELEDYCKSLKKELKYIEDINENKLIYPIDKNSLDKEKYKNTNNCKFCNCKFNNIYDNRDIVLCEKVDKNKLKQILDKYTYNEEVDNKLEIYYNSLNKNGMEKIEYSQSENEKIDILEVIV